MWFFDWGGNCPPCPPASYGLGHWHVAERLVNLKAINPFAPVLMSRKHIRHYSFYFRITKTNMTEIEWVNLGNLEMHLGNAYTKYFPLLSPERAECLRVCFHCLSGVFIITLNRSYRIRTFTPDAGDHGELFWSSFGWDISHPHAHTEAKCTGIMPLLFILTFTGIFTR